MFGRWTRKKSSKNQLSQTVGQKDMQPSVIASNMHLLGNIISDGLLDIDGKVDGNVRAHSVTVRPNGAIRGDVMAEDVFVYGRVEGLIKAKNVTLYETAEVQGVIMHEAITIEDGAVVDGKIKRMEQLLLADGREGEGTLAVPPTLDSMFDNDNDLPETEAEARILDSLRLIS